MVEVFDLLRIVYKFTLLDSICETNYINIILLRSIFFLDLAAKRHIQFLSFQKRLNVNLDTNINQKLRHVIPDIPIYYFVA